jgi:hypothetical protein
LGRVDRQAPIRDGRGEALPEREHSPAYGRRAQSGVEHRGDPLPDRDGHGPPTQPSTDGEARHAEGLDAGCVAPQSLGPFSSGVRCAGRTGFASSGQPFPHRPACPCLACYSERLRSWEGREWPLMAESDMLSAVQRRAIVVLFATGSPAKAAVAVEVSLRTVRRWQASPVFAEALRDAARGSAGEALSHLLAAGVEAVEALRETVRTGSPALRVMAAQILLENGLKVAGDDLDQRPSRLEERWQETSGGPDLRILSG